jgi:hypothetical protein
MGRISTVALASSVFAFSPSAPSFQNAPDVEAVLAHLDDWLPVEERHFDRKGRLARTMRFDEVNLLRLSLLLRVYLPFGAPEGLTLQSTYGAAATSGLLQFRIYL